MAHTGKRRRQYGRRDEGESRRLRNDPVAYILTLVGGVSALAAVVNRAWPSLDERLVVAGSVLAVGATAAALDAALRKEGLLMLASGGVEGLGQLAIGAVLVVPLAVGNPTGGADRLLVPRATSSPSPASSASPDSSPPSKAIATTAEVTRDRVGAFEGTLDAAPPCRAGRTVVVLVADRNGRTVRLSGATEKDGSWIADHRSSAFREVGPVAGWSLVVHRATRTRGAREIVCRAHRIGRRERDRTPDDRVRPTDERNGTGSGVPLPTMPPSTSPLPTTQPTPPPARRCVPPAVWNEAFQRCL